MSLRRTASSEDVQVRAPAGLALDEESVVIRNGRELLMLDDTCEHLGVGDRCGKAAVQRVGVPIDLTQRKNLCSRLSERPLAGVACQQQRPRSSFAPLQVGLVVQSGVSGIARNPEECTVPVQLGKRAAIDCVPVLGSAGAVVVRSSYENAPPCRSVEADKQHAFLATCRREAGRAVNHASRETAAARPSVCGALRFVVRKGAGLVHDKIAWPSSSMPVGVDVETAR